MPLFISGQAQCDFIAVETGENKIQKNDDVICIAVSNHWKDVILFSKTFLDGSQKRSMKSS